METIPELFRSITDRYSDQHRAAYLQKRNGKYIGIGYDQLRRDVVALALALESLGMEPGDRLTIVSENRYEWVITDLATLLVGGVDVPVFPTMTGKQIAYIIEHSQSAYCAVSNRLQLEKLRSVVDELSTLEAVIVFDEIAEPTPIAMGERQIAVYTLSELLRQNSQMLTSLDITEAIVQRVQRTQPDDLCTIIYTSGTTGQPKGVMLTHRNILSNVRAAMEVIEIRPDDVFLSYLPMCHSYERTTGYYIAFASGATVAFAESLETIRTNLQEVRPTLMTSVPQLFERIRNGIFAQIAQGPPLRRKVFEWAIRIGQQYIACRERCQQPSLVVSLAYQIADRIVFEKIRRATGGRIRFFVSGGGPLSPDVNRFFWMIGLPILEGYGLTEAAPVLTVNRLDDNEFGTVGKPLPGVEIRLDDNGEILARGPNIMRGYWRDPSATAEVIDQQGWLHTGDVGKWTERGNLTITDRIKNLIVTSGGKNVAPQIVERTLLQLPFISQAIVLGDKRPFCVALLVPDENSMRAFAQRCNSDPNRSLEELCRDSRLIECVQREIEHVQRDLAKYERVRRFAFLSEPLTIENGLLTPTMKPRRTAIEQRYAELIEELYHIQR